MTLTSPLNSNTYFSRGRRAASEQTRVPDWVWGAGLGAVALFFVGLFLLVTGPLSGGGGPCDEGLEPLGGSTVDAETFATVDASLGRVVTALQSGDRDGARANFYGPTHNFTHAVEPPLREVDDEAARNVCEAVLSIETTIEQGSFADAATDAQTLRDSLRDAAVALGYPRPG
ncbi:MAG TPA: hypothetical protein VMR52_02540 [Dehalococcoidia bacterium]|nr:hypothetical protein [Dehalococcoidia bacterium]